MKVELQTDKSTENPDEAAIMAARGDYLSKSLVGATIEDAMEGTEKTKEELIAGLLRSGHFGPFEHTNAWFAVEGISRVVMAQVTRHRHMSFDVQSMRYVDFDDSGVHTPKAFYKAEIEEIVENQMDDALNRYELAFDEIKDYYVNVEEIPERAAEGKAKQAARYLLPLGTKVNMTFSANSRALMHVFDLRDNTKAQPETQKFARMVREAVKEWAPLTFDGYEQYINNNSLRAP